MYLSGGEPPENPMPTQRPRLTVTLTPEVDRALTAFSEFTGTSKGAFILQTLEEGLPVLERLVVHLQAAKRAGPEALREVAAGLKRLERAALKAHGRVEGATDLFIDEGVDKPSGGAARRPSPPTVPGQVNPRVVTRGSGTPTSGGHSGRVVPIGRGKGGRKR